MTDMDVAGYGLCRLCNGLAPTAVLMRSGWICGTCTSKERHPASAVKYNDTTLRLPRKPRSGSKGATATKKAAKSARTAAASRLAKVFPGIYRVLLAEERAARGLDPYPIVHDPDLRPDQVELELEVAGRNFNEELYAALDLYGIGVDE